MYSITSESARLPDILSLIAALDRYQSELYPAESNHLIDLAALPEASLILMIIRDQQLQAVGCGAIVLNGDGTGEMKRVYIDPPAGGLYSAAKRTSSTSAFSINRLSGSSTYGANAGRKSYPHCS